MEQCSLATFLNNAKLKSACSDQSSLIHAVLGNETCDLDSAACAIAFAYYLHCTDTASSTVCYVPVLNISRADFSVHTDVQHVLESQCGLSDSSVLVFRDEICLEALHSSRRLRLTIVDFHVLPTKDAILEGSVVEVIDHRPRALQDRTNVTTTIELVGSCCTLVAEKILAANFSMAPEIIDLLYSAIIYDTVCLSDSAGRKTPKDDAVVIQLEKLRPSLDRLKTFDDLKKIKQSDVLKLSNMNLLQRDLKVAGPPDFPIAVPAIIDEMQQFLHRPNVMSDLDTFSAQLSARAVLLLFLHITDQGDAERQLAIYTRNSCLRHQIFAALNDSVEPNLLLTVDNTVGLDDVIACVQQNVSASRKAILPIIHNSVHNFRLCSHTLHS